MADEARFRVHYNGEDNPTYFGFLNIKNGKLLLPDDDDFEESGEDSPEHGDVAYRRSGGRLGKEEFILKGHIAFRGFPDGELSLGAPDTPQARERLLRLASELISTFDHSPIYVDFYGRNGTPTQYFKAENFSELRQKTSKPSVAA
jgi:hypothetical protein